MSSNERYSFERKVYVTHGDGTKKLKKLDFYRKGCFVLESKQGQDKTASLSLPDALGAVGMTASTAVKRGTRQWEDDMQRARRQAENYIRCYHGVGHDPTYNNTLCFDPFPFPDTPSEQQTRIRDLGEKLGAHRKSRQSLHPELTLTGMYNVLDALRSGRELTDKEKNIYEYGLVSILRELHDELDTAVADAYDWQVDLSDEEILSHLVDLNAERMEEEKNGKIRRLRPEYQTKSKEERKSVLKSFDFVPLAQPEVENKKIKAPRAKAEVKNSLAVQHTGTDTSGSQRCGCFTGNSGRYNAVRRSGTLHPRPPCKSTGNLTSA